MTSEYFHFVYHSMIECFRTFYFEMKQNKEMIKREEKKYIEQTQFFYF